MKQEIEFESHTGKQKGKYISSIVLGITMSSYWDIVVLQWKQKQRSRQLDVDGYSKHAVSSLCFNFMFTKQTGGYTLTFYVDLPTGRKCALLKTKSNHCNLVIT